MSTASDHLPLSGFTVLDFTHIFAGPYCTRMLADLGAKVIKIERPGEGDEIRFAPHQLDPERVDRSTYYVRVNAGKLSIAINLAHANAKEIVFDLLRKSDVVVENFAPGVMQRLGFDYAKLSAIKPDIVYCSIYPVSPTGPLSSLQAYAHLINAISGLMELDRGVDPMPRVAYLQAADGLAGTHAFGAINAALIGRLRTGRGAHIDVSIWDIDRRRRCHVRQHPQCRPDRARPALRHDRTPGRRRLRRAASGRRATSLVAHCRVIGAAAIAGESAFCNSSVTKKKLGYVVELDP